MPRTSSWSTCMGAGWVAVSMACQASQDYVLAKSKPVELFIGRATSVHVFGCPVSLCDDSLLAAFCVHGIPKKSIGGEPLNDR